MAETGDRRPPPARTPDAAEVRLRDRLLQRKGGLWTERQRGWDEHWRDISAYVTPRRERFLATSRNRGGARNDKILDETATLASRTLASGLLAGVSSPARPWFRLAPIDPALKERRGVRLWLHQVEQIMLAAFSRSNLYNVLPSGYKDLGNYGVTGITQEDHARRTFHFQCLPIGSYALANGDDLMVNTLYRSVNMTTAQMVERFGLANVSEAVRNEYQRGRLDAWHELIHAIEPNVDRDPQRLDNRNMPFRSVWLDPADDRRRLLRFSGFRSFPAFAPRWETVGADAYAADCPGMTALGATRSLQVETRHKLEGIDKQVAPPLQAPATVKQAGGPNSLPGGVTYLDVPGQQQQGIRSIYDVQINLRDLAEDIFGVQNRIRRAYYEDLFLLISNDTRSNITATEIAERHEEKLLMLGPVLQRVHTELLDPLIERSYERLLERGLLPEPPRELTEQPLQVEYISVLAQAQQLVGVAPMERFVGFAGNLAGAAPEVMDKLDIDAVVDEYAEMTGVPPQVVRETADAQARREQRAQAAAAQQAAEQAPNLAQGAELLSRTDTTRPSALSQLLGGVV